MSHYYLSAYIDERGQRRPFSLTIEGPYATAEKNDFYCKIASPELLGKEFNVYGGNGGETKKLAVKFVEICLQGRKIYDDQGHSMELSSWE